MELLLRDKVMELVSSELEALKQKVIENQKNSGQVASGRTIASMKPKPPVIPYTRDSRKL